MFVGIGCVVLDRSAKQQEKAKVIVLPYQLVRLVALGCIHERIVGV